VIIKILLLICLAFSIVGCVGMVDMQGSSVIATDVDPGVVLIEPWLGVGSPWVFYGGGWYYNNIPYNYYGPHGWAPHGRYHHNYLSKPNHFYRNRNFRGNPPGTHSGGVVHKQGGQVNPGKTITRGVAPSAPRKTTPTKRSTSKPRTTKP